MSNMSHCQVIKMTLLCHNYRVALIDVLIQSVHKLINTIRIEDCGHNSCLLAQYQSSYGHYTGNSSILVEPSSQITEPSAVSTQDASPLQSLHTLINTIRIKDCGHNSCLLAQYQSSSGHYTRNSSIICYATH
jgi:hypothetical protein